MVKCIGLQTASEIIVNTMSLINRRVIRIRSSVRPYCFSVQNVVMSSVAEFILVVGGGGQQCCRIVRHVHSSVSAQRRHRHQRMLNLKQTNSLTNLQFQGTPGKLAAEINDFLSVYQIIFL